MSIEVKQLADFKGDLATLKGIVDTLIKLHGEDTKISFTSYEEVTVYLSEEGDLHDR